MKKLKNNKMSKKHKMENNNKNKNKNNKTMKIKIKRVTKIKTCKNKKCNYSNKSKIITN